MVSRNQLYLNDEYHHHAVLQHEIADRLISYVGDVAPNPQSIVNFFPRDGYLTRALSKFYEAANVVELNIVDGEGLHDTHFADLLTSNLCMQDEYEIGNSIQRCWDVLKPNGLLMISVIGFDSLLNLVPDEHSLQINVFPEIKTLGNALHAAGFIETVMHIEKIRLTYSRLETLLADIRITGVRPFTDFKGLRTPKWFKQWENHMQTTQFDSETGLYNVDVEIIYGQAKMPEFIGKKAVQGEAYFSLSDLKYP